MAKKDINKQPFPEATMLKLDIFRRCFIISHNKVC